MPGSRCRGVASTLRRVRAIPPVATVRRAYLPPIHGRSIEVPAVILAAGALVFVVSAYAPGGCGATGRTASGQWPVSGRTAAADFRILPVGTAIHIPGLGPYIIQDSGRAIKGLRLDLYMPTCAEAIRWGVRERLVYVLDHEVTRPEWEEIQADVRRERSLGWRMEAPEPPGREIPKEGMSFLLRAWLFAWMVVAVGLSFVAVALLLASRDRKE